MSPQMSDARALPRVRPPLLPADNRTPVETTSNPIPSGCRRWSSAVSEPRAPQPKYSTHANHNGSPKFAVSPGLPAGRGPRSKIEICECFTIVRSDPKSGLAALLAKGQKDTWVSLRSGNPRWLSSSADPAERYPIIDITGNDMQLFWQSLPILRSPARRNCRLGKVGKRLSAAPAAPTPLTLSGT